MYNFIIGICCGEMIIIALVAVNDGRLW